MKRRNKERSKRNLHIPKKREKKKTNKYEKKSD